MQCKRLLTTIEDIQVSMAINFPEHIDTKLKGRYELKVHK